MSKEERCTECGGTRGMAKIKYDDIDHPVECANEFHKSPAPVLEFPATPETAPAPPVEKPAKPTGVTPICPHCLCEGKIMGSMTTLGGGRLKVFAVFCGNLDCRKYLGFFQPLELSMMPAPSGMSH